MSSSLSIRPSRAVGWGGMIVVFITFMAGLIGLLALAWNVPHLAVMISQVSDGILSQTLMFYAILLTVVGVVLFRVQHLRPHDVGLVRANIRGGVLAYSAIWASYQILLACLSLISQGHITFFAAWSTPASYPAILGAFVTSVFGVALTEEIVFRGYLLPQAWLALHTIRQPWLRLGLALLCSLGAFAIMHIPVTLLQGASARDLLVKLLSVFVLGLLLALVYLQTRNLYVVIAIHGLSDWPMPLFHQTMLGDLSLLSFVTASIVLILWPVFTHRSGLNDMALRFRASVDMPATALGI